ncbi:UNVERIFIED_CONTAM: hypothetical protein Sradi_6526600 [Sesamum radiatum]|uniref:Uncharacterized protein n=1 Tax=Sesamum radiatum TaxID=300843 RepID=A0AAW2JWX1_SESRA
MLASTSLWNNLMEPIQKALSSMMTDELKEHNSKTAIRVQGSRPVAVDSSTACTRPLPDFGKMAIIQSQEV